MAFNQVLFTEKKQVVCRNWTSSYFVFVDSMTAAVKLFIDAFGFVEIGSIHTVLHIGTIHNPIEVSLVPVKTIRPL